jgi:adenylosuccinate synthase
MVYISEDALLTTPLHWELNRWAERKRGADAHGTTGRGIGATAEFALLAKTIAPRMRDLNNLTTLGVKLAKLNEWVAVLTSDDVNFHHTQIAALKDHYRDLSMELNIVPNGKLHDLLNSGCCVFEGAQGVLLDENYGFHPHTTWSTTTGYNSRVLCNEHLQRAPYAIGVTRAYTTRHGAGPMVTYDPTLNLPELHNDASGWAGAWRAGHFDAVALKYAASVCHIDGLYATHVDTAEAEPALQICTAYDNPYLDSIQACNSQDMVSRAMVTDLLSKCTPFLTSRPLDSWSESISLLLGLPLIGEGHGPTTSDGKFFIDVEGPNAFAKK